jgi:hypothetical protein
VRMQVVSEGYQIGKEGTDYLFDLVHRQATVQLSSQGRERHTIHRFCLRGVIRYESIQGIVADESKRVKEGVG